MKAHNDIEQGSKEWFDLRKGKMTASHATAIGNCGKGLDTYINQIMSEKYSSAETEKFSNEHTDRGNEYEPIARAVYELENNVTVKQVGFIEMDDRPAGASPDGLVNEDGGLEIKCIKDDKYFLYLSGKNTKPDSDHDWQVQMNLLITKRAWWDLLYYNPNYQKNMVVFRIYPDAKKQEALQEGIDKGTQMMYEIDNLMA